MKFHKQLHRHNPENGVYGDCMRAVYASLLDKRGAGAVPHFRHDNAPPGAVLDRVDGWLRRQGFARFHFYFLGETSRADVTRTVGMNNPGMYYLLYGTSPRDTDHVVVCVGDAVLHDPHPDGGGIVGPGSEGLWCVEVLVPLQFTEKRRITLRERLRLRYVTWRYNAGWLRYLGVDCAKRRGRSWAGREHDRHWGPFTYSVGHERAGVLVRSGSSGRRPCLQLSLGRHTLFCELPRGTVRPWQRWVDTSRLQTYGQDGQPEPLRPGAGYEDAHSREYGFSVHRSGTVGGRYDHLSVSLGAQTMDSSTTQGWSCFLPWATMRHVRWSLLAPNGLVWAELRSEQHPLQLPGRRYKGKRWDAWRERERERRDAHRDLEALAPKKQYAFKDYDGELLTATCRITEGEWRRGEGWFSWLSLFYKPMIVRSLYVDFSGETGRRKGSWKGGTLSSSGPLRDDEHGVEAAFRAYCERKGMTFIGELPSVPVGAH